MNSPLIITDRLLLRKFTLEDAPFILELVNDPDWLKFIGDRNIHNEEEAKNYIVNSFFMSYQTYGFGPYLVALKDTEQAIGLSCLIKRDALENVDIGFAFLKKYRGNGFALEALKATKKFAHATLHIGTLLAITNTDNEASMKLLKRLDFRIDKKIQLPGEKEEVYLFVESDKSIT
jgi:RimJ/RimL family protein N-acetyltransferase